MAQLDSNLRLFMMNTFPTFFFVFFSDGSQEISVLIYSEEIWLQPSNGKPEEKLK